jgi:transposase
MAAHPELSLHWQGWPGAATTGSKIMNRPPLGLDLAKLKFNACLVRQGGKFRHHVFPNNPQGFVQLCDWLKKQGVKQVHACMEATGTYGDCLATYLHGQGHTVSLVNPAAIKAYAQSHL